MIIQISGGLLVIINYYSLCQDLSVIHSEVDPHYHARFVQARSVFLHADGLLVHTIMQNQDFSGTVRTFEC